MDPVPPSVQVILAPLDTASPLYNVPPFVHFGVYVQVEPDNDGPLKLTFCCIFQPVVGHVCVWAFLHNVDALSRYCAINVLHPDSELHVFVPHNPVDASHS